MKKNILIIGSSAAGIGAAVKLRTLDKESSITIVTAEQEMPYNRCLLADYLANIKEFKEIATKKEEFFTENNIALKLNSKVIKLLANDQQVVLTSGEQIGYDQLFLGVGRSSRILPLPGHDAQGVFAFYDLNDTNSILDFIKKESVQHAVIIGAGLSGVECADALAGHNITSIIIEQGPHTLPHQLNAQGAACLEKRMQKHGVSVMPQESVTSILTKNGAVCGVTLASGKTLETNMVIFAVGGKINRDLAHDAGIVCEDGGIIVDEYMRTSVATVFAGGDVCRIKDLLTGQYIQSCLWTDAILQGFAAAHTMSNQPKPYKGALIITSSHIFGTTFVTCGPINNQQLGYEELSNHGDEYHHTYLIQEGKLKGFCLVGNVNHVGQLRQALLTQKPFTPPSTTSPVGHSQQTL